MQDVCERRKGRTNRPRNNRKKNSQTGQYEDDPVFLDCEAFNRQNGGKLADMVEQSLRKGSQVFIEGHLKLDQWTAQDGAKRSKIGVVVDNLQFLDPRPQGQQSAPRSRQTFSDPDEDSPLDPPPPGREDAEVHF